MQYLLSKGENMIEVIIFDLDDTLYNERDFVFSGFMEVAKYLGNKYSLDRDILYEDILDIFQEQGRGKIFNILCDKHGLKENIENLVSIYRNTLPNIKLYNDALYVLEKLKGQYKLGIITDGKNTVQWNKLKALDVEKYMDKIIVTDDHGEDYWKPSEKPFKAMIKYFGGNPEEYIYIGDNPNKDFIGCKKLGIKTIRIIRETGDHMNTFLSEEYEADYKIKSLLELENILKLLK